MTPLLVPRALCRALDTADSLRRHVARELAAVRASSPSRVAADRDDELAVIAELLERERRRAWSAWMQGRCSADEAAREVDALLDGLQR